MPELPIIELRNVSFAYNVGYDYSAAKAYEFAEQTSTGFPVAHGFQVTASLIGQSQAGAAPADFAMEYRGWLALDTVLTASMGVSIYRAGASFLEGVAEGEAAAARREAIESLSPTWRKGVSRGVDLEFGPPGDKLPSDFGTFDYFNTETGMATSQKSLDLARSYANPRDILNTGRKAINDIIDFDGYSLKGYDLLPEQIASRRLDIIIPRGVATEVQKAALGQVRAYGLDNGIIVRIIEVR